MKAAALESSFRLEFQVLGLLRLRALGFEGRRLRFRAQASDTSFRSRRGSTKVLERVSYEVLPQGSSRVQGCYFFL